MPDVVACGQYRTQNLHKLNAANDNVPNYTRKTCFHVLPGAKIIIDQIFTLFVTATKDKNLNVNNRKDKSVTKLRSLHVLGLQLSFTILD